jgi:hypothetical protein
MSQLERDLHESLRRRHPPADFAARVLARTEEPKRRNKLWWRWLAAAALVVLTTGGVAVIRERRRQAEGERAKQELLVAFRITGAKLRDVQARLSSVQQRVVYPQLNQ